MVFSTVATVTSQPMSPTKEKARQILVVGTSDSQSSNQRRQARADVSNGSIKKGRSKSLIDALPEFLRAYPLEKRRLATRKSNSDFNTELRDWTQREELFYKRCVLYIPQVEAVRIKILKKHHDHLLAGYLATKTTHNTLCHKYFWPIM